MKKLILLLTITILISCKPKITSEDFYINTKCVIIKTNEGQGFSNDKYHNPVVVKTWLIKSLDDTTKYRELYSNSYPYSMRITNEMWYNHKIGDTLHYDYLSKSEFFTIK